MDDFDDQPVLTGRTLHLRPLQRSDFDALARAGGDPATWAGHPAKDRHERETFLRYAEGLLEAGGALVVIRRDTGDVIGASRYYAAADRPGAISVGFTFLDHRYWGGDTNFEMKALMLGHAFRCVPTVWFDIAPSNIRSRRATAKLGAREVGIETREVGGAPQDWVVCRLDRADWAAVVKERRDTMGYLDT